jgi:hypothetical protein
MDYGRNRETRGYEANPRGYDANRWENEGGRAEGEREGRGNFPRYEDRNRDYQRDFQDENRRDRGEYSGASRNADFGHRGDWGRQGSWGTYGNRPSYERREEQGNRRDDSEGRREEHGNQYLGGQYRGGNLESSQFGGMYVGEYGGRATGYSEGQHNQMGGMSGGHSGGWSGTGMPSGGYGGGMGSYSGGLGGSGRHSGRGPKNWQRSDERIREDANERLTDHPHVDATEIDIQVKNGEVTITGTVEDRQSKRMVEDLIEGISGVREVHNQLRTGNHAGQQEHETVKSGSAQSSTQVGSTTSPQSQTAGSSSRK